MITINIVRSHIIQFTFVCPICGIDVALDTSHVSTTTNGHTGYWAADHHITVNMNYTCSDSWDNALYLKLDIMYEHPYGDTNDCDIKFSDEQITEIRNGIEVAINKLYEENKCLYMLDTF